jgi:hypothetical protein
MTPSEDILLLKRIGTTQFIKYLRHYDHIEMFAL